MVQEIIMIDTNGIDIIKINNYSSKYGEGLHFSILIDYYILDANNII